MVFAHPLLVLISIFILFQTKETPIVQKFWHLNTMLILVILVWCYIGRNNEFCFENDTNTLSISKFKNSRMHNILLPYFYNPQKGHVTCIGIKKTWQPTRLVEYDQKYL
jgi:hypothetical protein